MNVAERYDGLQTVLEQGGKYGCLFLCLCSVVEEYIGKPIDLVEAIRISQDRGWLGHDFYCANQLAFLQYYTGTRWIRIETEAEPKLKVTQFCVERWVWNGSTHFKRSEYDVYSNSRTVKYGKVERYYVYEDIGR